MNPLSAVKTLVRQNVRTRAPGALLGSCFALRHRRHYLTAAHCVKGLPTEEVHVLGHTDGVAEYRTVSDVIIHPTADVAILTVVTRETDTSDPFWGTVGNYSLGEDFLAFGYPEDVFGANARTPTPRLFKGSFQRFFHYSSRLGYRYLAGELSIGCPAGLSGGPLFRPGAHPMLLGLVAENHESTVALHSEETVEADGVTIRTRNLSVINYGICVMLHDIKDWLDQHVPPKV